MESHKALHWPSQLPVGRSTRPGQSVLHNARPSVRLQPTALYGHREFKWEFCHIVHGDCTPVLAKYSKSFSLVDAISIGVDRMQRNFGPMQKQVESWRALELSNVSAKMIVYEAFIESELEVPKHLARRVHRSMSGRRPSIPSPHSCACSPL